MLCVICQDEIDDEGGSMTLDECGHTFHARCIAEWFRGGRPDCPTPRPRAAVYAPSRLHERAAHLRRVARARTRARARAGRAAAQREADVGRIKKELHTFRRSTNRRCTHWPAYTAACLPRAAAREAARRLGMFESDELRPPALAHYEGVTVMRAEMVR